MKQPLARCLEFAAMLCELMSVIILLLRALVLWEPPERDVTPPFVADDGLTPWERWADGEGRGPLASHKRGGDGMA